MSYDLQFTGDPQMCTFPERCVRIARLVIVLCAALAGSGVAQDEGWQLRDRIVATVNDRPILLSDVDRLLELGLVPGVDGVEKDVARRRALELLIDQRLRLQEVERNDAAPIDLDAVEAQIRVIEESLGGAAALTVKMEELELGRDELLALVAEQIRVVFYVEERLRPRVLVRLEDVRSYYDGELRPALEERGETPPPLEDVQDQIRQLLLERGLNSEIEEWTRHLRVAADIFDYLDDTAP